MKVNLFIFHLFINRKDLVGVYNLPLSSFSLFLQVQIEHRKEGSLSFHALRGKFYEGS